MIKIPWLFPDFFKKCQIPWLFPDWKSAFQFSLISLISRSGRNPAHSGLWLPETVRLAWVPLHSPQSGLWLPETVRLAWLPIHSLPPPKSGLWLPELHYCTWHTPEIWDSQHKICIEKFAWPPLQSPPEWPMTPRITLLIMLHITYPRNIEQHVDSMTAYQHIWMLNTFLRSAFKYNGWAERTTQIRRSKGHFGITSILMLILSDCNFYFLTAGNLK